MGLYSEVSNETMNMCSVFHAYYLEEQKKEVQIKWYLARVQWVFINKMEMAGSSKDQRSSLFPLGKYFLAIGYKLTPDVAGKFC